MIGQRLSKTVAAAALGAALALTTAAPASAEAAPPCEVMLPPDVCEQFFYGPTGVVYSTVYWAEHTAWDTAVEAAMFADATLKCVGSPLGWGTCN